MCICQSYEIINTVHKADHVYDNNSIARVIRTFN